MSDVTAPDGKTGKVPDFPQTRLALRAWRHDPHSLMVRSLNAGGGLRPSWIGRALSAPDGGWPHREPLEARCKRKAGHEDEGGVPDTDCSCGIYATTDLDVIATYLTADAPVLGIVELGGRVIPAEQGYRAQFGRVAAILLIDEMFTTTHAALRKLAGAYNVPALVPHSADPEDYRELLDGPWLADEVARYLREQRTS